ANLQLNQGAAFDNRSTLTVSGNSAILTSSSSSVINRAGATINVVAGLSILPPISNFGTINVGGNITLGGAYTQTGGQLSLHAAITNALPLNINGGALTGNGVISGALNMNSGVLSPGPPTGIIAVDSAYTQSANSALNIAIGGNTSGTQY